MWEIRIASDSYSLKRNEPFKKEHRDTCLTGCIKTKNEAVKQLKALYAAEEAEETKEFHSDDRTVRKQWINKDMYKVRYDYCEPFGGDCGGLSERVYLKFYKA